MDHRTIENFYAVVAPGLEKACAKELSALKMDDVCVENGGVAFRGKLRDLYCANLHLRSAGRVLVRFASFRSRDFPELFKRSARLPWGRFLRPETRVQFRVSARTSRIMHSERVAQTLESAINRSLARDESPVEGAVQMVMVRIVDDQVTLSIDSSGELLHKRGYRQSVTVAPLRETLAAGILQLAGWNGQENLADPMCGSGSFLAEGVLMAQNQAPGLGRDFAFYNWPGYRDGLWKLLCDEARREQSELAVSISGSDESDEAVSAATDNLTRLGVQEVVTLSKITLTEQEARTGCGLVVCNPPYGKRLGAGQDMLAFYRELGQQLRRVYPGWRLAMLCPDAKLAKATGLACRQTAKLVNGGLTVWLFQAEIPA
ncbi:MAG: class I SAM-dependent RNA methyltransferase [Desulfuromonadales bacterium]|nr:class I SAM-dependent RNA methyltransferase [Desulfuromonadales bacterium]